MEKLSQTIVSKINRLQRRMESILDNDFETKLNDAETQDLFEASRDLALIRGIPTALPDDHNDRAIVIFLRMALHFDSGFLLENQDSSWKAQAYFHRGSTHLLRSEEKPEIHIPAAEVFSVLSTNSQNMLRKLNMSHLDPENKTSCLMIKVSPDYAFILFSSFPDLWLKDHIENIRKSLVSGMVE